MTVWSNVVNLVQTDGWPKGVEKFALPPQEQKRHNGMKVQEPGRFALRFLLVV